MIAEDVATIHYRTRTLNTPLVIHLPNPYLETLPTSKTNPKWQLTRSAVLLFAHPGITNPEIRIQEINSVAPFPRVCQKVYGTEMRPKYKPAPECFQVLGAVQPEDNAQLQSHG